MARVDALEVVAVADHMSFFQAYLVVIYQMATVAGRTNYLMMVREADNVLYRSHDFRMMIAKDFY